MALPVFNEGTMRYHDSESNKMMKTSVAESILAASKPALTAQRVLRWRQFRLFLIKWQQ